MNAVITERLQVDAHHAVHITDPRLVPGEEVEVIVRSAKMEPTAVPSLLDLAATMRIDAPADYSVNFEQVLR